jgi:PAS domain S-box-containing protein
VGVASKGTIALISKSLDGRITSWDEGAETLFGYSAQEAIGKHISIVIPFDYQDEEYELLDRLKAEDYLKIHHTVRRTKDGRFLLVRLTAVPIRSDVGKITGALKRLEMVLELPSDHVPVFTEGLRAG